MTRYISVSMMVAMLGCASSAKINSQAEANKTRQEEVRRDQEVRQLEKEAEELAAKMKDATPSEILEHRLEKLRSEAHQRLDEFHMDIK